MKLLLNENVDPALAEELRQRGCDVVSIRDVRPGATDDEVLKMAVADPRILVTHDKDFGELAYHQGLPTDCGVILFRIQTTDFDRTVRFMADTIASRDDWPGRFSVVEFHRIRRRKLPKH